MGTYFLILIEVIDDAKSMSAQTTDFGMNYILYGAIHILYITGVQFLQLQCGNYLEWKSVVKPV